MRALLDLLGNPQDRLWIVREWSVAKHELTEHAVKMLHELAEHLGQQKVAVSELPVAWQLRGS